jgi:hypothetical protein
MTARCSADADYRWSGLNDADFECDQLAGGGFSQGTVVILGRRAVLAISLYVACANAVIQGADLFKRVTRESVAFTVV